jgi:hypothetical protein
MRFARITAGGRSVMRGQHAIGPRPPKRRALTTHDAVIGHHHGWKPMRVSASSIKG